MNDFSVQITLFLLPAAPRKQMPLCLLASPPHPTTLPPTTIRCHSPQTPTGTRGQHSRAVPAPTQWDRMGAEGGGRQSRGRTELRAPHGWNPYPLLSHPLPQAYPAGNGAGEGGGGGGRGCAGRGEPHREGEPHKGARRLSGLSTDRAVGKASRKSAFEENINKLLNKLINNKNKSEPTKSIPDPTGPPLPTKAPPSSSLKQREKGKKPK